MLTIPTVALRKAVKQVDIETDSFLFDIVRPHNYCAHQIYFLLGTFMQL